MNVIRNYKPYFEALFWQFIKAIRFLQYWYYARKLHLFAYTFLDTKHLATKQDFDSFRDKYHLSESMMGLLTYITVYDWHYDSMKRLGYLAWYEEDEILKLLFSGSSAWEKLQKIHIQLPENDPDKQLLEQLNHFLLIEMIEHKMYLKIPIK